MFARPLVRPNRTQQYLSQKGNRMPNPKEAIGRSFCVIVALCSLLVTMTGQIPQTPLASKFTSKDGRFSVKLPAEPTTKSEDISSDNGPSTLHTFTVEINGGRSFFLIGYSDYNTSLDVAKTLDGVISAQAIGMKGKITSDKTVALKGYSGRSVT